MGAMMQLDKSDWRVGPADVPAGIAEACAFWQMSRDNSSLLRAGARAETGIPHYFQADFIDAIDAAARAQPLARKYASTLLRAVNASTACTANGWCAEVGLPATGFAGRGLAPKPKADEQIQAILTGERAITMPLWGVSLNPAIAQSYGGVRHGGSSRSWGSFLPCRPGCIQVSRTTSRN